MSSCQLVLVSSSVFYVSINAKFLDICCCTRGKVRRATEKNTGGRQQAKDSEVGIFGPREFCPLI